jgi:truncated hemoglobin YjbI
MRACILYKGGTSVILKGMQTVFEAAGGDDGLRRLADAWHRRVMADDVVGHAFSHGFHPQPVEQLASYWAEALAWPQHLFRLLW